VCTNAITLQDVLNFYGGYWYRVGLIWSLWLPQKCRMFPTFPDTRCDVFGSDIFGRRCLAFPTVPDTWHRNISKSCSMIQMVSDTNWNWFGGHKSAKSVECFWKFQVQSQIYLDTVTPTRSGDCFRVFMIRHLIGTEIVNPPSLFILLWYIFLARQFMYKRFNYTSFQAIREHERILSCTSFLSCIFVTNQVSCPSRISLKIGYSYILSCLQVSAFLWFFYFAVLNLRRVLIPES
jgi:hypothetical protein